VKGVQEAIKFLEFVPPVPAVKINEAFSLSCKDLIEDAGPRGGMNNDVADGTDAATRLNKYGKWKTKVAELLAFGSYSARDVVVGWLVDDGIMTRPNRHTMFDPEFHVVGIASGPHSTMGKMVAVAFAGNYVEGEDTGDKAPRVLKVNQIKEQVSFDSLETKDKKGYLVHVGKMFAQKDKLKLFKEGRILNLEKIVVADDGEPRVSNYRTDVPFDFEPVTVIAKLADDTSFHIFIPKPAGSLNPNEVVVITQFSMGPIASKPNDKMTLAMEELPENYAFRCGASSCKEDITLKIQGKVLMFEAKRYVKGVDDQGEFEKVVTSTRKVSLPIPVGLSAFRIERDADGFSVKVIKPTSSVDPNAKIELPIQEGEFDFE